MTERKQHVRMHPEERKKQLDGIVLSMFRSKSVAALTRKAVSDAADVSEGLIHRYYINLEGMRKAAIQMACTAMTKQDIAACKRAVETGDITQSMLSKKMQAAIK